MNFEDSNGKFTAFTFRVKLYCGVTLTLSLLLTVVSGQFVPPNNGTCACLNQNLTYTCTVEGSGATIWKGNAFECAQNRILLRHEAISSGTAIDSCNDGSIIARGVGVRANRYYTSELVANVSNELSGSTISCELSSGGVLTPIGSAQVNIITGPYQLVPVVRLAQASANRLRFNWPSVDPSCSAISYEMTTSDSGCGTCSIATNTATATATCTGWQLGSMCEFSVRSAVCGFTGMPSNTVTVAIRVPDPPQVEVVPVYSADTNSLTTFLITIRQTSVTDPPIAEYITSYSSGMQRNTSCMDDKCEYEVSGPFQECTTSSSSTTSVTVSASNAFGQGAASGPLTFGCTNQFVQVNYTSPVIVCTFLNAMDTSIKSCTVMYGSCDEGLDKRRNANSTMERPNYIEIQLDPSIASLNCFMYVVTASNDTYSVVVENTRSTQSGTTSRVVIIAVLVPGIGVVVAISVVAIVIIIIRGKKYSTHRRQCQLQSLELECHIPVQHRSDDKEYLDKVFPHLYDIVEDKHTESDADVVFHANLDLARSTRSS